MQQYRINYTLLIALSVGMLVTSGAVYALWRFQIERKSHWLISEAEKAEAEGNARDAERYYWQYLTIHKGDPETRLKYAKANADIADLSDVTPLEFSRAWQILEGVMRDRKLSDLPETRKLRRRLIEIYGRVGRHQDALDHLGILLEVEPQDAELQGLRATYLIQSGQYDKAIDHSYKLIGYDLESETFDTEKAIAPHDAQIYANLAMLLRTRQEAPELADKIMDQLVEVNPDSAEAYLARGRYLAAAGEMEDGRADVEKAYSLKPEEASVLVAMASHLAEAEQYEEAIEFLEKGKKLHPKDVGFYQLGAEVEIRRKDYDAAMAEIDKGLETIGFEEGSMLLLVKANLQLNANDLKGVQDTIDLMKRQGFRTEFIDWYGARILLAEDKWFPASEALNRLRARVANARSSWPLSLQEIDYFLGLCYERLGRHELAYDQYDLVLQQNLEHAAAKAGRTRVARFINRKSDDEADPWQELLAKELEKPEEQRDWTKLDDMLGEMAKEQEMEDFRFHILQANLMMMRRDFDGAAKALAQAYRESPDNLQIHRLAVQLALADPKMGPEKAMERWQQVYRQFGDSAALRLDKAAILAAMKNEDIKAQLANLLVGIDDWSVEEKVALWGGLAARYLNLGMNDEARQYLSLAADHQPNELPLRLSLFTLALDANDEEGMKDAQKKILDIVKDRDDSTWLYTEARRKLWQVRTGRVGNQALEDVRQLVRRGLQQRPDWHELHLVNAELELAANRPARALRHYDTAASLGRPYPGAVAIHIRLLALSGRFDDAGKQLDRLPEHLRFPLLGQLYPEILFRTNQVEDAILQARAGAEDNPNNAQNHYWYSQLLARSSQAPDVSEQKRNEILDQAIQAMQRTVELQPELSDAWRSLIAYYMMQKKPDLAQKTLRDAQLAMSGDNLQEFLAKSYEALGRWFDAETMYRSVYEAAPDNLARAQQLAAFYLGQVYQRPDRLQKAAPLINKILRAGAEKKIEANDPALLWARRQAATMMAATGEYQSMKKAENLLTSNAQDGALSVEDKLELAQILAPRPEPESRNKAMRLLEEVAEVQPLNEQAEIALGELYYRRGDWAAYARQMRKAIGRFPSSATARASYAGRLLKRGDRQSISDATEQVTKIRNLAPNSTATFELTVRLANKLGRQQQARAELLRMLPNIQAVEELGDSQLLMLDLFANLFIELGDLDSAEKIYRDLVARDPRQKIGLALFLGLHRSPEQCFDTLKEMYSSDKIAAILDIAMQVVESKRDQVGDKFDPQIERWLATGNRENPDSIPIKMLQARFFDLQKRYDDAAGVYLGLLENDALTGFRRAIVLNNLSFLLALDDSAAAASKVDPLKLVNEAIDILGPSSDILDTRAVVWISRGDARRAIQDLELSVTDSPTASKYFHKAQAHLLAGENRAAVEAWEQAEELELRRESLNRMEYDKYDETKSKIEQIRGGPSGTQADRLRKAG